MAHHGEELALSDIGLFGGLFGFLQIRMHLLNFGDVHHGGKPLLGPVGMVQLLVGVGRPNHTAISSHLSLFHLESISCSSQHFLI